MIGVIGDLHLRDKLSYANYYEDQRLSEKKKVLDFIVKSFVDCDKIVFLGDQFHGRNNQSAVITELVEFLERFDGKDLYILCGNHEASSDNTSALDFLNEVKNKKWSIIDTIMIIDNMVFCPYVRISKVKYKDGPKSFATQALMKELTAKSKAKPILFLHQAISQSPTTQGDSTDLFNEIVLPRNELSKAFALVVSGHIHQPYLKDNVLVAGSVFTSEVGETDKFIWKIDEKTLKVTPVKLPVRPIFKIENPTLASLAKYPKNSIIKVLFTKKQSAQKIQSIKAYLRKFDATILVEQYPRKRTKVHFDEGMLEFSIIDLIKIYAKERKVDESQLLKGFELLPQ